MKKVIFCKDENDFFCLDGKDKYRVNKNVHKTPRGTNYYRITISENGKSKHFLAHRLVWEATHGKIPKGMCIDHIDGNGLNNSLDNLRILTYSQNAMNKGINKNNKSGYKGVRYIKEFDNYMVQVGSRTTKVHTKRGFKTAKEAALHYNKIATEMFGEYARLNEV